VIDCCCVVIGGQGVHHVVQRVAVTGVTNIVSTPGSANATKPVTKLRPIKPAGIAVKRNPTTLTSPALSKTGPAVAVVQSSTEVVPSATQVKAMTGMQTATKFVVSGSASDRLGLSAPIDMATAVKATLCSPTAAPTVVPVPMATEDTVASIKTGVDSAKQKAVVKPQPQILTHVIDGFVILEGTEPFPVSITRL
jgi:hypothetical protein